jgi:DNA replication protein DnaC
MELREAQGTQNPEPGNTRTRKCSKGCGATTIETYIKTGEFRAKVYGTWISDQWPAGLSCPACSLAEEAKKASEREAQEKILNERRAKAEQEKLFKMFGGQRPLDEFTFERFEPVHNFAAFQRVKNFNPLADNLFLYGPTGTGKTHLAVALAREMVDRGLNVSFYKVPALMREFRRNLDPDAEESLIRLLASTAVLVIDDMGVGKATEYVIEKLHEVIDARQNQYRAGLVITSNLSLNGIAETFKDRIADRLNGMCDLVKVEGDSHRKRSA